MDRPRRWLLPTVLALLVAGLFVMPFATWAVVRDEGADQARDRLATFAADVTPLLAGGRGGLGAFTAPSAGFLIGWLPGAAVTGWIVERGGRSPGLVRLLVACAAGGMGVVYLFGIPVQAFAAGISLGQAALLTAVFLPGDVLKTVVAAIVVRGTQRAYPDAIPAVREERLRAARER